MWINIPFLRILNYIIADHGGSENKTTEEDSISCIVDVVILDQDIGGRLIRIYGIGIGSSGFHPGLVDFIPLYGHIVRIIHFYAARTGFLGDIPLHDSALYTGQINGIAGIVRIFLA